MSPALIWQAIVGVKTAIITGFVVAAICLPLGYCQGHKSATNNAKAARALANVKALATDAVASDRASAERVADALIVQKNEEELLNAIADIPDSLPSPVRVAAGCHRLRAQGTREADIPEVCRPAGGDRP